MKQKLDFYMMEFVGEWDFELAELVTVSDLSDIEEHKNVILKELYEVQNMMFQGVCSGEYCTDDLVDLTKVILWLIEL